MGKVEFIIYNTEEEYREEFRKKYVNKNYVLEDVPVIFTENDFDHIFKEPAREGGYRFSKRRAKRMHFMQAILSRFVEIEIMFEEETGNIAIFCMDLECVMYLRIRPGKEKSQFGTFQVGTFFDFGKGHEKMCRKQKKKCSPITLQEIKQKYM
jgi:hypothetical protein